MVIVWRGVESIRHLQAFGAPFMFVMAAALLIWVRIKAGSFGTMLSTPSQFHSTGAFLEVFFPSLTAMVGYWATLALNIPDFTRYSKSQHAQAYGQAFGLPVAMTLYTFVGISVTSASTVLFGRPIWNPIELIGAFHQPVVAFIALIAILIATLNVNIGANVVSPSNDFSNLYPRLISFRTGGLITGFLGLAMCPWKLLATPDAYIFGWLVGYSGLLGPVAGIMVSDYFLIRKTELDVNSLYHSEGIYHYTKGINPRAIVALVIGVAIALVGVAVKPLHFLYDYAWFVGFFTAGAIYVALMKVAAPAVGNMPVFQSAGSQSDAHLKQDARLGDEIVVVGVEAGSCDLHAAVDDEEGMIRLPCLFPDDVKGPGSDEVLHLAVMASSKVKDRVVLHLEPDMRGGAGLRQGIPGNGSSLAVDFAGWQRAAERGDDIESAPEGKAGCERGPVGVRCRSVLVAAGGETVTEDSGDLKVAVFGIAGCDAVLRQC